MAIALSQGFPGPSRWQSGRVTGHPVLLHSQKLPVLECSLGRSRNLPKCECLLPNQALSCAPLQREEEEPLHWHCHEQTDPHQRSLGQADLD